MATRSLNSVLHHVRMLAAVQTGRALSDPELLRRFVNQCDEAAFTVLIERHGPMVLGVCQRALRHSQDAEDACQATFLVLARKASSIRKKASLGSWLHGIACRICANLRRQQARRRKREQCAAAPVARLDSVENWHEVQGVLDEELQLLPERYRAPLLLCYWEGKTRDEAADQLGLTTGKLHGLLERGRSLLRDRLTERGLTLSAALCASFLATGAANAALAPTLVVTCAKAAAHIAAGKPLVAGTISQEVLILTKEILQTMFITKLKIATAYIGCLGLLATVIGGMLATTGLAQTGGATFKIVQSPAGKGESDEAFIRRISKDLRGIEPSPAEVHFFVHNKDAGKRQRLIDLFIQERQAKAKTSHINEEIRLELSTLEFQLQQDKRDTKIKPATPADPLEAKRQILEAELYRLKAELEILKRQKGAATEKAKTVEALKAMSFYPQARVLIHPAPNVITLQNTFLRSLVKAADEKKPVAGVIEDYRDSLVKYLKAHPKAEDVPEGMLQIVLTYRAQGRNIEADAWSAKLKREHPASPAARQRLSALENASRSGVAELHLDGNDVAIFFLNGLPQEQPQPKAK